MVVLAGCATLPPPDTKNPVKLVAVLPMVNNTNDLDGPVFVREAFDKIVPARFYETMPFENIDEALRDKMGITLGGQLDCSNPGAGAPSPQEVGKLLGVDGLFYGTLIEFKQLITGFYNNRKVKAKFKLVNVKTGEVIWENEAAESSSDFNITPLAAIKAAATTVAESAIKKALKVNPLGKETNAVVSKLKKTIPSGPVAVEKQ
ncbi:MAG: DUF799 family lipoprotein [Nitrospirae bacterium]|nr:DUF799 family lipoprotein [Nitrospirota bacterium]